MPNETDNSNIDAKEAAVIAERAAADKATADKAAADKAADDKKSLDQFPKELQEHVRDLRKENEKKTERLKALEADAADKAKKLTEYEKAEEDRNRKALEEEKKFKEIADQEIAKREKVEQDSAKKLRERDVAAIRSELRSLAREANIIDVDDVKSIDVKDLRIDDEGNVPGAKEAIEALKASKPHWFKVSDDTPPKKKASTTTATSRSQTTTGEDSKTWDKKRLDSEWATVKL